MQEFGYGTFQKANNMREKIIEEKLRTEVKKLGGTALKFTSPSHSGVFDRIVLMPAGKVWFVELKKPGKDLSPLQKVFRKELDRLQQSYRVIDDMEKLHEFLSEIKP
jgi:hypothetical protein